MLGNVYDVKVQSSEVSGFFYEGLTNRGKIFTSGSFSSQSGDKTTNFYMSLDLKSKKTCMHMHATLNKLSQFCMVRNTLHKKKTHQNFCFSLNL